MVAGLIKLLLRICLRVGMVEDPPAGYPPVAIPMEIHIAATIRSLAAQYRSRVGKQNFRRLITNFSLIHGYEQAGREGELVILSWQRHWLDVSQGQETVQLVRAVQFAACSMRRR